MYQHLYGCLLDACGVKTLSPSADPIPDRPILYFCMERDDIYNKVIGDSPKSIPELDYLFARNAYKRFGIEGMSLPEKTDYAF